MLPTRLIPLAAVAALAWAGPRANATEVRRDGDAWIVSNAALKLTLTPGPHARLEVVDTRCGAAWRSPEGTAWNVAEVEPTADGLRLQVDAWPVDKVLRVAVTLAVPDGGADVAVRVEAPADAPIQWLRATPPLGTDAPEAALAVADYSNGHLYPLDRVPPSGRWCDGGRLDLPFVGLVDGPTGAGCNLILATPDDAVVETKPPDGDATAAARPAPQLIWRGSKGVFAYPREAIYRFTPTGGHVALAKGYRAYAQSLGLLVTLAEKARANPKVARLFGATNVWGGSPRFVREAHAAGVDRLLINGHFPPADIRAFNDLGYLTSEYDNYTDVEPLAAGATVPDSNHDRIPDNVVLQHDGERMKAWLTYDKKTQFMKRCPALWVATAQQVIPKVLAERPFLARFIDVTTAEGLYECFDPAHPLDHRAKRHAGEELLREVRAMNLVVGGEHGIWWAVPHADYFEGLMSHNPSFAWPAGHLIRPKSKEETYTGPYAPPGTWADYERDGIGHESRVPLWELVFHDCVVTTWYWGDSSDFLSAVDPANQDRKDAFNILYGTMPMLWAGAEGSWPKDRERFLRTCREVGAVTRTVATSEMLSHEFITPDRAVQRTRFANGVEVVVNFGPEPYRAEVQGRTATLPQYGYLARGPGLDAARAVEP